MTARFQKMYSAGLKKGKGGKRVDAALDQVESMRQRVTAASRETRATEAKRKAAKYIMKYTII